MSKDADAFLNSDLDSLIDVDTAKQHLNKPLDGQHADGRTIDPMSPTSFRIPKSLLKELAVARIDDEISASARVIALLRLWRDDPELQQRVKDFVAS